MGKGATVNIRSFNAAVRTAAVSKKALMFNAAKTKVLYAKENMLKEFDEHVVTKELLAGPDSMENPSGTLGGRGNLYAFIGFIRGTKPTDEVRKMLSEFTNILNNPTITDGRSSVTFTWTVVTPSLSELFEATPLEFDDSKSWLKSVEKGLWGLTHYLNGLALNPSKDFSPWSNSGPAIEVKGVVRSDSFKPTPYITEILNNFKKRISTV